MTANLKVPQPNTDPLSTDAGQFALALTGAADVGAMQLVAAQSTPAAPTVSAGSAGNLNGAYLWKVVLITGWQQSDGSYFVSGFAPSADSSSLSLTNAQANLSAIATGTSVVLGRAIYRTAAGGASGTEKFVGIIWNNTATTWTDNVADANIGTGMPTSSSNPAAYGVAIPANVPTTNTTGTTINGNGTISNATNIQVGSTSYPGSQSATANTVAIRDANSNVAVAMPTSNGQNPNLLFNPSARLGLTGWGVTSGSAWSATFGQNYGEGGLFQSPNIATSGTYQTLRSQQMPVTSGFALTLSAELNSVSLTAGFAYVNIEAFNASNTSLGSVIVQANPGQNWTKQSTQYTTPANTTYVTVTLGLNNAALGQAYFRKVKVEAGSYATTFSDDNTLNTTQYGTVLPFMIAKSGGNLVQSGQVSATGSGSYTVTFPTAFTTVPIVVATYDSETSSSGLAVNIVSRSTTAVTLSLNGGSPNAYIQWVAIGT